MSKAKKHAQETETVPPADGGCVQAEGAPQTGVVEERVPQEGELETLRGELAQANDRLLRLRAEFDNYRRRTAQEAQRLREGAVERVALAILPGLDDLERVIRQAASGGDENLRRGLELVLAKFHAQLEQVDVRAFESRGQLFDPARHEALTTAQDPSLAEDMIVDELVRGYLRGADVMRHAQVVVNKPA